MKQMDSMQKYMESEFTKLDQIMVVADQQKIILEKLAALEAKNK